MHRKQVLSKRPMEKQKNFRSLIDVTNCFDTKDSTCSQCLALFFPLHTLHDTVMMIIVPVTNHQPEQITWQKNRWAEHVPRRGPYLMYWETHLKPSP
jgi:hypothetical protein